MPGLPLQVTAEFQYLMLTVRSQKLHVMASEIVSLMGLGTPREDIACGAVGSVVSKVSTLVSRKSTSGDYYLTGGFCESPLLVRKLGEALSSEVKTCPDARFAGAIGAALLGK